MGLNRPDRMMELPPLVRSGNKAAWRAGRRAFHLYFGWLAPPPLPVQRG